MNREQIEQEIKQAVATNGFRQEYAGQPGSGIIFNPALRAVVDYILPLLEEIESLKKQVADLEVGATKELISISHKG